MKTILSSVTILLCLAIISCQSKSDKNTSQDNTHKQDMLYTDLDTTVNPADDFFDYANGGWIKTHPIPKEYSSYGIGRLVQEDLFNRLKIINEDAVKNPKDDISKKIANFWKNAMDSTSIENNGAKPLQSVFSRIDNISDKAGLLDVAAYLNTIGVSTLFSLGIEQDQKKSDEIAIYLYQGGLGLPDRDYYFNTDEQTAKLRNEYPRHIAKMLSMLGQDSSAAQHAAQAILHVETQMAKASRKLEDLRDPYTNYNKFSIADIKTKLTPDLDWISFLPKLGIAKADSIIVGQPEFFTSFNKLLNAVSIDDWKNYLKFHTISEFAPYLSSNFEDENFRFYSQLLNGVQEKEPRWKRSLYAEEDAMGEALGQLFVKEYFNEKAKKRYENLVEEIRTALKDRINKLDWMSPDTKVKALDKLAHMSKKVGYPDKWKDFSKMDIKDQSYVLNMMAAHQWWHNYEIAKLGKPVDRDEWAMTPQTYNAYYNPSNNEIVLPAGIFAVQGMMDDELDDALVYGYAAASTIGHEITHGFDDQGRQYDKDGNLKNWWTKEDEEKFNQRAEVMIKQFDNYEPLKGKHINGKATLGENIADLGGVLLGWDAFVKTEQYKKGDKINGLTPAQRYFLGYSLGWLYSTRDEALAQRLMTDVHSPAKYRVNGPFSNVPAFYEVFNVKPSNGMYIADTARVKIW